MLVGVTLVWLSRFQAGGLGGPKGLHVGSCRAQFGGLRGQKAGVALQVARGRGQEVPGLAQGRLRTRNLAQHGPNLSQVGANLAQHVPNLN